MIARTREEIHAYLEHWKRVGPKLEAIQRRELRNYDFAANRSIIDSLLQMGLEHASPRTTSGLVDLQRKLKNAHERRLSRGA